jgi:hypothetical protein
MIIVMEKSLNFKTSNEFKSYFEQFKTTTLAQRLTDKYRVRPFFERYKSLCRTMQIATYALNLFSVATAFMCVFAFLNIILPNALLSIVFSASFLVGIEHFKRLTIPNTFKAYFQFKEFNYLKIAFIVSLMLTSCFLSYTGAGDAVQQFTPKVTLIDTENMKNPYQSRIKNLEKQLKEVKRSQSWQGVLTPQGQKTYNAIQNQVNNLENQMFSEVNTATTKNDVSTNEHNTKTGAKAYYFSLFALILDLLLIGFFFFIEYYDYRSYTEFATLEKDFANDVTNQTPPPNVVATNDPVTENVPIFSVATANNGFSLNSNTIELAIKKAKANIAAFKAKIRNDDGNRDTNEKGIERWELELSNLEQMKPQAA